MFALSTMTAILLCILLLATPQVHGFQTPAPMMAQPQQQQHDTITTSRRMTALDAVVSSRQAFLASSSAAVVAAAVAGSVVVLLPPVEAAHADEYDDARAAKRAKDAESKGGGTLAIPLIGGLALSLPFFLPNILRLLGVKNSKMKD
jgi:hypothetical protein